MLTVRRRMTPDVLEVAPTESLAHAAQVMVDRKVGSAIAIEKGEVVGILTERDVLRAVGRGLIPWGTTVADCMTEHPVTVSPETSAGEALNLMMRGGFRHLPVMHEGALVGIVSMRDLITGFAAEMNPEQLQQFDDFETLKEPW